MAQEDRSIEIGGAPVVTLESPAPADADRPAFLSAQALPGRGMTTLQIRAHLPSRGATDLLEAPPLEEARAFFDENPDEFQGNRSYLVGGAILLPYANRIRGRLAPDGRTVETEVLGRTVHLPANSGGRRPGAERYSMHGLLLDARPDDLRHRTSDGEDRVTAAYRPGDFGGRWPSATEVTIENVLRSDSFTLTVTARNTGGGPLPLGIGWHPYFALPAGPRQQARMRIPARGRAIVNDYDEVLPTGEVEPVADTPYDFSMPGGRSLGDLYLDDCFVDLERTAAGEVIAEVVDPAAAYGLRVVADSPFIRAIQVFAPPHRQIVVLEPQFNRADPFGAQWGEGADTGMAILAPGESAFYSARLELFVP
ncbi:MAG TPA: aldose 1-epimerase [Thermoanaerobaculia bacterium]|nr:aldose 1-epimerase [Thermoanaerobaculia bacterium]